VPLGFAFFGLGKTGFAAFGQGIEIRWDFGTLRAGK